MASVMVWCHSWGGAWQATSYPICASVGSRSWEELGWRRGRHSSLQFVGALQLASHQLVGAFVVLGNTPFASFGLADGLLQTCTASVAVSCTRSGSSMSSYVGALDTSIGVAVTIQVVRVDA